MRPPVVPLSIAAVALATMTACGTSGMQSVIENPPPVSAPPRFLPSDTTLIAMPADTLTGAGCLSPLAAPMTGVRIVLVRSESGLGDYQAPSGSFGLRDDQLLRLECNTGKVLGVVRR